MTSLLLAILRHHPFGSNESLPDVSLELWRLSEDSYQYKLKLQFELEDPSVCVWSATIPGDVSRCRVSMAVDIAAGSRVVEGIIPVAVLPPPLTRAAVPVPDSNPIPGVAWLVFLSHRDPRKSLHLTLKGSLTHSVNSPSGPEVIRFLWEEVRAFSITFTLWLGLLLIVAGLAVFEAISWWPF